MYQMYVILCSPPNLKKKKNNNRVFTFPHKFPLAPFQTVTTIPFWGNHSSHFKLHHLVLLVLELYVCGIIQCLWYLALFAQILRDSSMLLCVAVVCFFLLLIKYTTICLSNHLFNSWNAFSLKLLQINLPWIFG